MFPNGDDPRNQREEVGIRDKKGSKVNNEYINEQVTTMGNWGTPHLAPPGSWHR